MKRSTFVLISFALVAASGCDPAVVPVPTQGADVINGAPDATSASSTPRKWTLSYQGDLEGTIGGDQLVVTEADRSTKVEGSGEGALLVNVLPSVGSKLAQVALTLPDGTKCAAADFRDPAQIEIAEAQPMAFQATLSGSMACGDDKSKKITFEALLNAAL